MHSLSVENVEANSRASPSAKIVHAVIACHLARAFAHFDRASSLSALWDGMSGTRGLHE